MNCKYVMVFTTVDTKENALKISRVLVEKSLVACVNIVPEITSVYSWNGDICEEGECLLVMKTVDDNFQNIQEEILKLHPYDVCELLEVPVLKGYDKYLNWISESVL